MGRSRWPRQGPVARLAPGDGAAAIGPLTGLSDKRFQRLPMAEGGRRAGRAGRPACRVRDDPPDERLVIGRVGLVARPEVEDATPAALVATAAAEHLAALEPAHEDEAVGRRDVEVLAVHLLAIDVEPLAQAFRDRMARIHDP